MFGLIAERAASTQIAIIASAERLILSLRAENEAPGYSA
jgi:hypothetical protein